MYQRGRNYFCSKLISVCICHAFLERHNVVIMLSCVNTGFFQRVMQ